MHLRFHEQTPGYKYYGALHQTNSILSTIQALIFKISINWINLRSTESHHILLIIGVRLKNHKSYAAPDYIASRRDSRQLGVIILFYLYLIPNGIVP